MAINSPRSNNFRYDSHLFSTGANDNGSGGALWVTLLAADSDHCWWQRVRDRKFTDLVNLWRWMSQGAQTGR